MVRQIYIPKQVKDDIQSHITTAISRAQRGFGSAFEDEDVLTGQLFGLLRIDEQTVDIDDVEIGGSWKWSIDYKKFGGRGKGATESILGADGIIELVLFRDNQRTNKSLLFQSKLDWKSKDERLYHQAAKLMTWLGAAIVINYTEEQMETFPVDSIIANQGRKPSEYMLLQDRLGGDFINCLIGDSDLQYNAFTKRLSWIDHNYRSVATQFSLNRRLKINVKAPKKFPYETAQRPTIINSEDITLHPLNSTLNDYDVSRATTMAELRKFQARISKVLHPDKHLTLPQPQIDAFTSMMKFYNNRIDEQKEIIKRKMNK